MVMYVNCYFSPDYLIGDDGSVVSVKFGRWKVLKQQVHPVSGGLSVKIDNVRRHTHRLVMSAFLGPSDLEVNHKQGDRTDNRLESLEYVTPKENIQHAINTGLRQPQKGSANGRSKLTETQVIEILGLRGTSSQAKIAIRFGVSQVKISQIWQAKSWRHLQIV